MRVMKLIALMGGVAMLTGCASLAGVRTERAALGYITPVYQDLSSLPPPEKKIPAAVYKFRDQTGQYKVSPNVTTFSTAVTQGATSMLIKALEESGWFIPVEREALPNLLTERKVIRAAREQMESQGETKTLPQLPPLIYASVMLEGGIIAYESNVVTGGIGAKYFGLGGSAQIRWDQVTVYLRAVAIKDGRILNSVTTTKTILSTMVDAGVYRFVRLKRLLEIESGVTTNEPPQMAVAEAIEKAVYALTIEGVIDGNWSLKEAGDIKSPVIQRYLKEKEEAGIAKFDREGKLITIKKK